MKAEVQDTPEFRLKRNDVLEGILDYAGVSIESASPEARLDELCSLGEEGFIDSLTTLNRILTKNHGAKDYLVEQPNFVMSPETASDYQAMPTHEDKSMLLARLYSLTSYLAANKLSSVEHIAAVMGFGINAIHPFPDGNGRTARTAYTLLSTVSSMMSRLDIINSEFGDKILSLNPSIFTAGVYKMLQQLYGTHYWDGGELKPLVMPAVQEKIRDMTTIIPANREFNVHDANILNATFIDQHLKDTAPCIFLKNTNSPIADRVHTQYRGQDVFLLDTFAREATSSDMAEYYLAYRQVTSDYAWMFLDYISDWDARGRTVSMTLKSGEMITLPITEAIARIPKGELILGKA